MSVELINHNADLKRLKDEGYVVEAMRDVGFLLIHKIPYVNSERKVVFGTLISTLNLAGDTTVQPDPHTALWAGDYPCRSDGSKMEKLVVNSDKQPIREGLVASYTFSQKPKPEERYKDYYHKMATYVNYLEAEARVLEPNVTAKTFSLVKLTAENSVFCYADTASSRA